LSQGQSKPGQTEVHARSSGGESSSDDATRKADAAAWAAEKEKLAARRTGVVAATTRTPVGGVAPPNTDAVAPTLEEVCAMRRAVARELRLKYASDAWLEANAARLVGMDLATRDAELREYLKAARLAKREANLTAAFLRANLDRLAEANDATLEAELGALLADPEPFLIERTRERDRKYSKAYRERAVKDPAKKAAFLARKNAVCFYKRHREGPEHRAKFATPRELADWKRAHRGVHHLRRYKELLDAGYPDGIPSGTRYADLRERYAELEQLLDRSP